MTLTTEDIQAANDAADNRDFLRLAQLKREYKKRTKDDKWVADLFKAILDTIPDSDTDTRPMDAASITEALRKSK